MQTASVSVRALIEEKIINKRITNPQNTATTEETTNTSRASAPPLFPLTVHSSGNSNDLDTKITSFVVPAPPHSTEKIRRHSDAEAFTVPRAPNNAAQESDQSNSLADVVLKKEKVSVKRTTSDPGQPTTTTQQIIRFQSGESFTLAGVTYQSNEDAGYLSPSLQDEVFNQVPDTMLLQGVDAQQLASIQFQTETLLQDQSEQHLQDIALEDYANLHDSVVQSPSYQSSHSVNQDLQAVLDSPLPESLAEFSSTFHSGNLDMPSPSYQTQSPAQYSGSPHPSLATQSPLQSPLIRHDSPGFAYPTPPASHEGQSPCFGQNSVLPMVSPKQDFGVITRDIDEPPQASSPLSAAFFTSTMSSSAAVEEALEEVLPGEFIPADELYSSLTNSPPPQSPLSVGLTPVPSPLSSMPSSSVPSPHPATYTLSSNNSNFPMSPHFTLQSQMMPNSDDPLLSSSPKDFVTRKKLELNGVPLKVISSNGLIDLNGTNFAGILVDSNGELKFIQTGNNAFQTKNILLTGANLIAQQNTLKDDDLLKGNTKAHKILKTVQCTIPVNARNAQPIKTKFNHHVDGMKQEEGNDVFLSPTT